MNLVIPHNDVYLLRIEIFFFQMPPLYRKFTKILNDRHQLIFGLQTTCRFEML